MSRTTEELVRGVARDLDEDMDITFALDTIHNIVNQVCLGSGYSDETLELIERWGAAHFAHCKDPAADREQAGKVSVSYQGRTYTGFRHTTWGQMAMLIDTAGNLKALDDPKRLSKLKGSILYIGGGYGVSSSSGIEGDSVLDGSDIVVD